MVKFPEASARIIDGIFVCKKCKAKRRAERIKVIKGKVPCRNCGSTALRPLRKK